VAKKKQANRQTLLEEFQYPIEKLLNGKIDTIRIQIHDRSLSRLVTSMSKKWWVKLVLEAQTHKRDNSGHLKYITSYRFPYINAEVLSGVINCISDRARFLGFAYVISLTISISYRTSFKRSSVLKDHLFFVPKVTS
jgi:hypothetical protein